MQNSCHAYVLVLALLTGVVSISIRLSAAQHILAFIASLLFALSLWQNTAQASQPSVCMFLNFQK